ncbi:Trehalose synthase [ANME-1 cluster archaeon GoMg2]|nr:Trehalose synthase [ANME-1 cluster archaeon GoMg2]
MNIAKVGTLFLQPIPRYINAVSIKVFEYMLCGLPVVASNFPELRKVVKEADCGILVDPTNVDEITDAILYLLEHPEEAKRMGENGRRAVEENYNWEQMEEKLLKLYEGLETCQQS